MNLEHQPDGTCLLRLPTRNAVAHVLGRNVTSATILPLQKGFYEIRYTEESVRKIVHAQVTSGVITLSPAIEPDNLTAEQIRLADETLRELTDPDTVRVTRSDGLLHAKAAWQPKYSRDETDAAGDEP